MVFVDSIRKVGILDLKEQIIKSLPEIPKRNVIAPFRMPIDQVFSLQGKGTIVRGTIFEGSLQEGQVLYIKPNGAAGRARTIQVHNNEVKEAYAGQRTAINITGVSVEDVTRGDVLVTTNILKNTKTIDISLQIVKNLELTIKQRESIKLNVGTTEVMGQIVFFDRNDLLQVQTELILCQIRLEEPIAVLRGDKFIIRRPSPAETIGGGWIIDPNGGHYRHGIDTIHKLKDKMDDSPQERIIKLLEEINSLSIDEITEKIGMPKSSVIDLIEELFEKGIVVQLNEVYYALTNIFQTATDEVISNLSDFQQANCMQLGMNKAELLQTLGKKYSTILLEAILEQAIQNGTVKKDKQYISLYEFVPSYPSKWKRRMENIEQSLKIDGLKVKPFEEYVSNQAIPSDLITDLRHYLVNSNIVIILDEKHLLHTEAFVESLQILLNKTSHLASFSLQDAKQALDLSRKYLIMYLEMLDREKITRRRDEQREWVKDGVSKFKV
jgi:selenocysteine-specific elongation factor